MANDTTITLTGNITADPELRFTPNGAAVTNFTIASTPRTYDRQTNEWKDGETIFMRCQLWREAAENAANTLKRGMRVIATGRLTSRSWDDKDTGAKRTAIELVVDEVGPSLRYATAVVTKRTRDQQPDNSWGQQPPQAQQQGDPWMTQPQQQAPQQPPRPASPPAPQPAPPAPQPGQGWQQQPAPQSGWGSGAGTSDVPVPF